jgi:Bacterial SH3 domain
MKGFLLFLTVGSVAIYTLLVITHDGLQDGKAENTFADQPQPNPPVVEHLSSWGAYLPNGSLSQKPEAASATSQQPSALLPQPNASQDSEREPSAVHHAPEDKASAGAEPERVERTKVVLAAQMHSEGSVSAPTVRYYRPGTELQVVGRGDGWIQVSDPVTQERGWIFEKYLSSVDSSNLAQVATESTTEPPMAKPASPKSKKRSRSARLAGVKVAKSDPWKGQWTGRADGRGFGLFRPFARFAAQTAYSPVLFAGPQ